MTLDATRDLVFPAITRHGSRTAVIADGRSWTFRELRDSALRLAGMLVDAGVRPGEPVAIVLENSAEYLIADLAIIAVGAAKVPVNMMLSNDEMFYILEDSGTGVVLASRERAPVVDEARRRSDGGGVSRIQRIITVSCGGSSVGSAEAAGPSARAVFDPIDASAHAPADIAELAPVTAEDLALIMYTGGTTGRPKGVVHLQKSVVSNLLSHVIETEITADDHVLLSSPLPHSAGVLAMTGLLQGAIVDVERKFDMDTVLRKIEEDGVSFLFMVPTMINRLLDAVSAREGFDAGSLRTVMYGASPITEERLRQGLGLLGPVFVQLYGQTEVPNFLTRLRRDDHDVDGHPQRLRSCGQAALMAEVRTIRKDGSDCDPGEVGEVIGRSPYVMDRYLGKPEATAETVRNGWLYTGDLGYLDDDGYLYLVDRKKEMIITGGFNVYASEVEQALATLPGVRESAVVGVPHADWGEAVIAYVIPTDESVRAEDLMEGARAILSNYKRPKEVRLTDVLPTTAVGKIDKKKLRGQHGG